MSRHICILTSAHPIDDVRVNYKIAVSFLDRGCRVSWVGPDTSYFTGEELPDKRINYVLTRKSASRLDRLRSHRRIRAAALSLSDVDWYYSPDPDAAEIAIDLARRSNARVMFDVHEIFHGALLDRWLYGRKMSVVRNYVRSRISKTCTDSDLVMGVSESVLRPYTQQQQSSVVVRNCAPRWFAEGPRDICEYQCAPLRVMHGKGLPSNGTPALLEALAALSDETSVSVVLFPALRKGEAPYMPSLHSDIARLGVQRRLQLRESLPHREMPGLLRRCDVGLIAYGRGLGEDSLPNRLFEYMAAGLAVVAPSYATEIRRIIDTENIGLTVDVEEPQDLANALAWLAGHPAEARAMGNRSRAAFLARHNWDTEFNLLFTAMTDVENQ
jgi:glycosyltransferase involved in cell wall biosynthesis